MLEISTPEAPPRSGFTGTHVHGPNEASHSATKSAVQKEKSSGFRSLNPKP